MSVSAITRETLTEALELIQSSRELLCDESRWTTGAWARDWTGRAVAPGSRRPEPVAWCLVGALVEADYRFIRLRSALRATASVAAGDGKLSSRFVVALGALWFG